MRVRDLISGTTHAIYGPMMRGFFRDIDKKHFNTLLFQAMPINEHDIIVPNLDDEGNIITCKKARAIRKKAFARFKKNKKQYEIENKLAIERLHGRK